jgi:hypothetical protein
MFGQPVTIHTFGIGHGHSADLLQAIAQATSGTYYYVDSSKSIAPAYGEVLGGLLSVVATNGGLDAGAAPALMVPLPCLLPTWHTTKP